MQTLVEKKITQAASRGLADLGWRKLATPFIEFLVLVDDNDELTVKPIEGDHWVYSHSQNTPVVCSLVLTFENGTLDGVLAFQGAIYQGQGMWDASDYDSFPTPEAITIFIRAKERGL